jgi:hypothetical protein
MKKQEVPIKRSNNKGERLIIVHAIAPFGVLAEQEEETSVPISNLHWRGNACHPQPREDGKLTCETIWKSVSRKGDYHKNMNSEMFLKWIKENLLPTFESIHPGKTMCQCTVSSQA